MKPENFLVAITILSDNHSNEIIVNKSTGHGSSTGSAARPTLHIKNCVGAVINKLIDAKFALSMDDGLLKVEDYTR